MLQEGEAVEEFAGVEILGKWGKSRLTLHTVTQGCYIWTRAGSAPPFASSDFNQGSITQHVTFMLFICIYFSFLKLQYSWFTILCLFQVYSKVIQLYMYMCAHIYIRLLQNVPVLHSRSLLIIYFIFSSVYMLIPNS